MSVNEEQFTKVLSVLSESVRYRILSLIASKGELTAKDILSEFDFTQPTLSHHMACLLPALIPLSQARKRSSRKNQFPKLNPKTLKRVRRKRKRTRTRKRKKTDPYD